jgi:hypothetical protein
MSSVSDPPAPRKCPPPHATTFILHNFSRSFFGYIPASTLSPQIIWPYHCGVWKGKKGAFGVHVCKGAPTRKVKNHNQQNMKATNCPNATKVNYCYNFFYSIFFLVIYGTEIDHFHHFLTAFCRVGGHTTPRMPHSIGVKGSYFSCEISCVKAWVRYARTSAHMPR